MAQRRAELGHGMEKGKAAFEAEILRRHRALKRGLAAYIVNAPPLVMLTAPVIYALIVPLVLLDIFVSLYQAICFPVYGIEKVRRQAGTLVRLGNALRPQPGNASRQLDIRNQLPALRLGAEQHREDDRAGGGGGADQHRYREAHVPVGGEVCQAPVPPGRRRSPPDDSRSQWLSPAPRSGSARPDNAAIACACPRHRTSPAR